MRGLCYFSPAYPPHDVGEFEGKGIISDGTLLCAICAREAHKAPPGAWSRSRVLLEGRQCISRAYWPCHSPTFRTSFNLRDNRSPIVNATIVTRNVAS